LPLYDNAGAKLSRELLTQTLSELTDAFGGATAFTRSPAEGFWADPAGRIQRDDVIVVEVMVPNADDGWWSGVHSTAGGAVPAGDDPHSRRDVPYALKRCRAVSSCCLRPT
jgi:hypothetical protein